MRRHSTSRKSLACSGMLRMLLIWVVGSTGVYAQSTTGQRTDKTAPATCPVTLPRKAPLAPSEAAKFFGAGSAHWHGALFVGGLWPDGTIVFKPSGSGFILPDGSLSMKFGWFRGAGLQGKLTIHGKRLDASAPPLRARIPEGYGATGFQSTALIFPTEGCWEVIGQVGETSLTFVTRVVKVASNSGTD